MKKLTEEEKTKMKVYIEQELRKGRRNIDIKDELGVSNYIYAAMKKEMCFTDICETCGAEYEKIYYNQKYCSEECKRSSDNAKKTNNYYKKKGISKRLEKKIPAKKEPIDNKSRPFTEVSIQSIVINDFEGMTAKEMAELYIRTQTSVEDKLQEVKASGKYKRIISKWKIQSPYMYKKALKKQESNK